MEAAVWLPIAFVLLLGLSILLYVILDGYDLGVGILLLDATPEQKDQMIASIGPFWDANETWLVLAVGILLVAFPIAHGKILSALYLPVAIMVIGLILRGVAFDFRAKVHVQHKHRWDQIFFAGSLMTSLTQGYILGMYIVGFKYGLIEILFSITTAICLAAGYAFIGACWLIMKTSDALQNKAIRWARIGLWLTALGLIIVSIATPLVNKTIFEKWFSLPNFFLLMPIPIITGVLIAGLALLLHHLPQPNDKWSWTPFIGAISVFILGFHGLAYSFYPYIIPEKMTIWAAASAPESLMIIFIGAIVVLPCIIGYTIFSYRVFWGKVRELRYH
jgi:cytochrome d ubiquinol oxidase subunit II